MCASSSGREERKYGFFFCFVILNRIKILCNILYRKKMSFYCIIFFSFEQNKGQHLYIVKFSTSN